jgi:hypothetical protein
MKTRFPTVKSAWRDRFVEIARQVEAGSAPRSLVVAAGLRARKARAMGALALRARAAG